MRSEIQPSLQNDPDSSTHAETQTSAACESASSVKTEYECGRPASPGSGTHRIYTANKLISMK